MGAEAFLPTNPEVTGVKDRPVRSALDVEICAVVAVEIRGVVSREAGFSLEDTLFHPGRGLLAPLPDLLPTADCCRDPNGVTPRDPTLEAGLLPLAPFVSGATELRRL